MDSEFDFEKAEDACGGEASVIRAVALGLACARPGMDEVFVAGLLGGERTGAGYGGEQKGRRWSGGGYFNGGEQSGRRLSGGPEQRGGGGEGERGRRLSGGGELKGGGERGERSAGYFNKGVGGVRRRRSSGEPGQRGGGTPRGRERGLEMRGGGNPGGEEPRGRRSSGGEEPTGRQSSRGGGYFSGAGSPSGGMAQRAEDERVSTVQDDDPLEETLRNKLDLAWTTTSGTDRYQRLAGGERLKRELAVAWITGGKEEGLPLSKYDLERCARLLGPSTSLSRLLRRCDVREVKFVSITCLEWIMEEGRSAEDRECAVNVLYKCVGRWNELDPFVAKRQKLDQDDRCMISDEMIRVLFLLDDSFLGQEAFAVFTLMCQSRWTWPDRVWMTSMKERSGMPFLKSYDSLATLSEETASSLKSVLDPVTAKKRETLALRCLVSVFSTYHASPAWFTKDDINTISHDDQFAMMIFQILKGDQAAIHAKRWGSREKFALELLTRVVEESHLFAADSPFSLFIKLFPLLEDPKAHILDGPFMDLTKLYAGTPLCEKPAMRNAGSAWQYSSEWTAALLGWPIAGTESTDVVKLVLGKLLMHKFDFSQQEPFPDWFLFSRVVPALDCQDLYMASMYEASGLFRLTATTSTLGKFKKAQERVKEQSDVPGFDLCESLFTFLNAHFQAKSTPNEASTLCLSLLRAVTSLKSSSAVCTLMDALARCVINSPLGIPFSPDHFNALRAIMVEHIGDAGVNGSRIVVVLNCCMSMSWHAVAMASVGAGSPSSSAENCRFALRLCDFVHDGYLRAKGDSPLICYRGQDLKPTSVLQTIGECLPGLDVVESLFRKCFLERESFVPQVEVRDCALLYASWKLAKRTPEFPSALLEQVTNGLSADAFAFIFFIGRAGYLINSNDAFSEKVVSLWAGQSIMIVESTMYDDASLELLEDAWIDGGVGRASVSVKSESHTKNAFTVLQNVPFGGRLTSLIQALAIKAAEMFTTLESPLPRRVKSLVVLATLVSELLPQTALEENGKLSQSLEKVVLCLTSPETDSLRFQPSNAYSFVVDNRRAFSASSLQTLFYEQFAVVLSGYKANALGNKEVLEAVNIRAKQSLENFDECTVTMALHMMKCLCDVPGGRLRNQQHDANFLVELLKKIIITKSLVLQEGFVQFAFSDATLSENQLNETSKRALTVATDLSKLGMYEFVMKNISIRLFHVNSPWHKDPSKAQGLEKELACVLARTDKMQSVLDYSAGAAAKSTPIISYAGSRFEGETAAASAAMAGKLLHPSAYVRFACMAWLNDAVVVDGSSEALQDFGRSLADAVLAETQALLKDSLVNNTKQKLSEVWRIRNLSFALVILSKCWRSNINRAVEVVKICCALLVQGAMTSDVRENVETVLCRMTMEDVSRAFPIIVKHLKDTNQNATYVMSLLQCASIAWHASKAPRNLSSTRLLFDCSLIWMCCAKSSLRILAANVFLNILDEFAQSDVEICPEIKSLRYYYENNGSTERLMSRITLDQQQSGKEIIQGISSTDNVAVIFERCDFNMFGDLCPRDLRIDHIAQYIRYEQDEFMNALDDSGEIPMASSQLLASGASAEVAALASSCGNSFFQRKIDITDQKALITSRGDDSPPDLSEYGSARQPLVIVASFVDRIPNIAGLVRTCEVFRVRTLAINDISVLKNEEFKTIARSAENWQPLIQVKENEVADYIAKLKLEEGYHLIALEQTLSSVSLPELDWPRHGKVCVVLGAERTGVPASVLALVDETVEIPQLGLVKSLNVHVSGALCVYAYTHAAMQFGGDE